MPVTAKLSRRFYETFGDELANELVDWFNQVDATYRADLRELNELNFARFDANLGQRLAEQDARWGADLARLEAKLEQRLAELEHGIAAARTELRGELNTGLARHKADLTRLMFRFWLATLVPLAGLLLALHGVLP